MLEPIGRTPSGEDVHRITLAGRGLRVCLLTLGGVIERIEVPDRAGQGANVVLGLPSLEAYVARSPRFGALIGRYANRIAGGRFVLDGVEHRLARNNGDNSIHGGVAGFDKRVWAVQAAEPARAVLCRRSADGEEGFPGELSVTAGYAVADGALRLTYQAETTRPTVLNLTNHSYFNLGGEGSGSVLDHLLQVEADHFVPVDEAGIPLGGMRPVAGTPFDFRTPRRLGDGIRTADEQVLNGRGYDHCFMLRPAAGLRLAARLHHPGSGRTLEAWTTEPGVQVYTANALTGSLHGPSGRTYRQGDAVCLETQHPPDSPNRPDFPSTVLRPGAVFRSVTEYRFSAA